MTRAAGVRALLDTAQYQAAYDALREALLEEPGASDLVALARDLKGRLERWCEELGSSRATEHFPATHRYAVLLEQVHGLVASR